MISNRQVTQLHSETPATGGAGLAEGLAAPPVSSAKTGRKFEIDTLRGLACIMLVAYHVVGYSASSGLRLESGFLRDVNDLLSYFRMPLFTVLSGYVYALRPFSSDALSFVQGKARRLLLPMLFVGTLFALSQALVPGANGNVENWWLLHILPYGHFWFVESLFLIFLLVMTLEYFQLLRSPLQVIAVFSLAALAYTHHFGTDYFSIRGAVYLLPYFLMGLFVSRFEIHKQLRSGFAWLFLLGLVLYAAALEVTPTSKWTAEALLLGGAGCLALLSTRFNQPWLAEIGRYSYAIFLFHVFFTAGCRIVLNRLGVEDTVLHFLTAVALGLLGPIALELILRQYRLPRLLLMGQK